MRYDFDSPTIAILRALYVFPYLTPPQACRLLYSSGSIKMVMRRMKQLSDANYLMRYRESTGYSYSYWLANLGRTELDKHGYDRSVFKKNARAMEPFIRSSHFPHCQAVTDFLIEASLMPGVEVKELLHDFTLHSIRRANVIPDGWLHLVQGNKQHYFCIEVDMHTEKQEDFQNKIGAIVYFDEYKALYGNHQPLWIFWTPKGESRRDLMLSWMEDKLKSMYQEEKASWFRVGSCELSPDMFFTKCWYTPFKATPGCLLSPASYS